MNTSQMSEIKEAHEQELAAKDAVIKNLLRREEYWLWETAKAEEKLKEARAEAFEEAAKHLQEQGLVVRWLLDRAKQEREGK